MTQARSGVCAVSVLGAVHAFGGAGMAGGALRSGEFFVPGTGKVRPTDAAASRRRLKLTLSPRRVQPWGLLPDMPYPSISAAAAVLHAPRA
jgi:hypothetical protein